MKPLSEYLHEEVAISLGTMMDRSNFATPGNTMGMGDPKLPTPAEPGSGDVMGITRKDKEKKKKAKTEEKVD